jgi:hypothetical protein
MNFLRVDGKPRGETVHVRSNERGEEARDSLRMYEENRKRVRLLPIVPLR